MAGIPHTFSPQLFTFDGLNRLTAMARGNLTTTNTVIASKTFGQNYGLDQLNNWPSFAEDSDGNGTNDLTQTRAMNPANEITQINPSSTFVAHDAAGNMTTLPQPDNWGAGYTLTWDAWNRLVKVADGGTAVAEYQYDGLNRRILKLVYASGVLGRTIHYYLSEDDQVLETRLNSSTNAYEQFTWGERYIDDLVLRTRDTNDDGTIDETLYALQDANWNVTALTDDTGAVVERFRSDPYGRSTLLDPNFALDSDGISDYDWNYRFTSRELDAETGLHYFRARYYHDGLGRFIGRDPLGYIDGENLYAGYFVPGGVDPQGTAEKKSFAPWRYDAIANEALSGKMSSDEYFGLSGEDQRCHQYNARLGDMVKIGEATVYVGAMVLTLQPQPKVAGAAVSTVGKNRLIKDLHSKGFRYKKPSSSGGGRIYENAAGDQVRIMPKPKRRPFRDEPPEKFLNDHYVRCKPKGEPEGPHISLPD